MDIGNIAYNYNNINRPFKDYAKAKGYENFGSTLSNTAVYNSSGIKTAIVLHGKNDADQGEESVGSWASVQSGVSTSVYKPNNFSEDNPYYHIKIWKPDGTMEERMVDVINYNPREADSFDHYAYACYIDKEEGMPVETFALGEGVKTENDLYQKRDWVQAYKNRMQQQYDVGYLEGYMRFKKMYERLLEQFLKIDKL